jgi:hypothetical protein
MLLKDFFSYFIIRTMKDRLIFWFYGITHKYSVRNSEGQDNFHFKTLYAYILKAEQDVVSETSYLVSNI